LKKTYISSVILASGTLGFSGEGYPYHRIIYPFVQTAKYLSMFVAKTVTVDPVKGKMPLKRNSSPAKLRPDCIFIDFKRWWRGGMLNAVGLSNFGLKWYLEQGLWQKYTKSWALSIMFVRKTCEERIEEAQEFVAIMLQHLDQFDVLPIIKLNISCPNTCHNLSDLIAEQREILSILATLGLDIIVKVNAVSDIESIRKIADHEACKGICVSNTLPWNDLPEWIKWKIFPEVFGRTPEDEQSDVVAWIEKYGGGGFSGKDCLPVVVAWIARARQSGIIKPIIGGGGIFSPFDAWRMKKAGATSISIGSPLLFRPWTTAFFTIPVAKILF
jgi:dihydroorotate dehydrogenase